MRNAASVADAIEVGRSVARSSLFKAAVFGKDPNWGRVLASIGTTQAAFDPADLDVAMNGVWVCRASTPAEDPAKVDLSGREVSVDHRPEVRRRAGHRVDQRPHPRLRPREQRVLVMSDEHRRHRRRGPEEALHPARRTHAGRRPAVADAVPRQGRGGEVRRQRDDRRRPEEGLRRGHRVPALRRVQARRGPRRRPADLHACSTGSGSSRSSRAACGSPRPRRWTSSGWCWSARCSASWSA